MTDQITVRKHHQTAHAYELRAGRHVGAAVKVDTWKILDLETGEFQRPTIYGSETEALAKFGEITKDLAGGWRPRLALVRLESWMIANVGGTQVRKDHSTE